MKNISVVAAGLLALGWATASAETAPAPSAAVLPNKATPAPAQTNPPPRTDVDLQSAAPDATQPPPLIIDASTPAAADVNTRAAADVEVSPTPPVDEDGNPEGPGRMTVEPVPMVPAQMQPLADVQPYPPHRTGISRMGGGFLVGGGLESFTNSNLRSMTGLGGYWSARVIAGTRQFVGLEAAYVGDARNMNALGLSSDARLISNGIEGALRVNLPMTNHSGTSLLEPFGFVGLGWSRYAVTNSNVNTSDVSARDDVMTLPFGGGLAFGYGGFMADARFTYRRTYYNSLVPGANLDNWGVGGQLGFGF